MAGRLTALVAGAVGQAPPTSWIQIKDAHGGFRPVLRLPRRCGAGAAR